MVVLLFFPQVLLWRSTLLIIHNQEPDSRQLERAVEEKAVEGEAEGVRPSRLRDP